MVTIGESDPFTKRAQETGKTLRLAAGRYGKPELVSPLGRVLSFNASRTTQAVVVAIAEEGAVGIDMESTTRAADMTEQVLAKMFAPSERSRFHGASGRRQALIAWTRKEAVAKADGRGLALPFDQIVTHDTGEIPAALPETLGDPSGWALHSRILEDSIISTAWLQPRTPRPDSPHRAAGIELVRLCGGSE